MPFASLLRLTVLAALWGASFLFLRLGVPDFGVGWIIELRVAIAFVFLALAGRVLNKRVPWRQHGAYYTLIGLFNSAAPFLLFAYAARTLPASMLSVFNATAPIWGGLLGVIVLRQPVGRDAAIGLLLGVLGVGSLAWNAGSLTAGSGMAMAAAALAPLCYAIASALAKRAPAGACGAFENATGSMAASSLLVLPLCLLWPLPAASVAAINPLAWGAALALGIACTGIAYLLYFRLLTDEGPMKALSVTFLIPVFGTLWGVLFLGEALTRELLLGGGLILAGTVLTTGAARLPGRAA